MRVNADGFVELEPCRTIAADEKAVTRKSQGVSNPVLASLWIAMGLIYFALVASVAGGVAKVIVDAVLNNQQGETHESRGRE